VAGEGLGYGWIGVTVLPADPAGRTRPAGHQQFDAVRSAALLTSLTITAYTLVDRIGAHFVSLSSRCGCSCWARLTSGFARVGRRLTADFANWKLAIGGAALSTAAYGIAIWAMTVAPIALVAALRETSVLFAALLGMVLLREPVLPARIAAACLVLAGVVLVRLR
jgi:drug/metabolite transporter (DMT)-like permease